MNSKQATHFRRWATGVLREYIVKGFALDDKLLKKSTRFGKNYFDHLLSRIHEIHASERKSNQKITDLYATSADYNLDVDEKKDFFPKYITCCFLPLPVKPQLKSLNPTATKTRSTWKDAPHGKTYRQMWQFQKTTQTKWN